MNFFGIYILTGSQMDEIQEMEKKGKMFKKAYEDISMSLNKKEDQWHAKEKKLQSELRKLKEEVSSKDEELIKLGADNATYKNKVSEFKASQRKLIKSVKEKTEEVALLNEKLGVAEETISKLTQELNDISNSYGISGILPETFDVTSGYDSDAAPEKDSNFSGKGLSELSDEEIGSFSQVEVEEIAETLKEVEDIVEDKGVLESSVSKKAKKKSSKRKKK